MKIGKGSFVSPKASIYGDIEVGNNSRIDDFCILTGNIKIGNNVHIGCFSFLSGTYGITIGDFVGISPRTSFFTASDDYSGESLSNPTIPLKFRTKIDCGEIIIKRHVLIGCNTVILPNTVIGEGCSCGAFSLINKNLDEWKIYVGIPVKVIGERSKKMLELEKEFLK